MRKFIISIFIYCISFSIFAAKYYVSSSTGSDNNNGLTEQTAWKSLAKVQSEASNFSPGDVIAFKSGDTWNETLTLVGKSGDVRNPIIYTSYGIGDKPIFDVVEVQSSTWINKIGNIWYQTSVKVLPQRMKIDGVEVLQGDYAELGVNVSGTGKDPRSLVQWNKSDQGDGGTYLYLYSSVDPNSRVLEWSVESRILYLVGSDNLIFKGIEFKGGKYESIKISGCGNLVFDDIASGEMSYVGLGVFPDEGVMSKDIIVKNSIFDTKFTIDFSRAGVESMEHRASEDGILFEGCIGGEIKNNYVKNWGHSGIALGSEDSANTISGIKIYDNYLTAPDLCYGGGFATGTETKNNEVYNNLVENISTHNKASGFRNHIHHNILRNIKTSPIKYHKTGYGLVFQTSAAIYNPTPNTSCQQNIVENNIFINCESGGFKTYAGSKAEPLRDNIVRNNIAYNCGSKNNNIGLEIHYYKDMDNKQNTYQNNIIYSSVEKNVISFPTSESSRELITVAQFNAKNGDQYMHIISDNISDDPNFINNSSDWHLQSESPAINSGATPLSTKDYEGNVIPNNGTLPDIGIYEYFEDKIGNIEANVGEDQTICKGASVTLTASGGSSYSWNTGATTKSITVSPDETTTYTVMVSEGDSSDSDQVLVTVNSLNVGAGGNITINEGESVTLSANGGDSYIWNTGETTESITVSPTSTSTYTVTGRKGDCEGNDSVLVTVNNSTPTVVTANAGEDQTICKGEIAILTASGGSAYEWNTGETSSSIYVNPIRTTSYTVRTTGGSITNSDTVQVIVESCPSLNEDILQHEITLYPNPTKGDVNISVKNVDEGLTIFVSDAKGSIVYSDGDQTSKGDFNKKINLSQFNTGVYYVGFKGTTINEVKKIVFSK